MKKQVELSRCLFSSFLCLIVLGVTTESFASNITIGRYLSVAAKAQNDQAHLLQQHIQITFPQNILSIQDAMQFILQFSGYRLCDVKNLNASARAMLRQPLPEVDRTLGPMTLEQGLQTLAGNMFYILLDPIHRLIGFQLKPAYRDLYQSVSLRQPARGSNHDNNNE